MRRAALAAFAVAAAAGTALAALCGAWGLIGVGAACILVVPLLLWPGHPLSEDWHVLRGLHVRALSSSRRVRGLPEGGWRVDLAPQRYVFLFPVSWLHGDGLHLSVRSGRGAGRLSLLKAGALAVGSGLDLPWSSLRLWNSGRRRYRVLEMEGCPADGGGHQTLVLEARAYRQDFGKVPRKEQH